jgi:hypothetical protein
MNNRNYIKTLFSVAELDSFVKENMDGNITRYVSISYLNEKSKVILINKRSYDIKSVSSLSNQKGLTSYVLRNDDISITLAYENINENIRFDVFKNRKGFCLVLYSKFVPHTIQDTDSNINFNTKLNF